MVVAVIFRVRFLGFSSGQHLAVIDDTVAPRLGVLPHDRIRICKGDSEVIAIVSVASNIPRDIMLVNDEIVRDLELKEEDQIDAEPALPPRSLRYIRDKLRGARLGYEEVKSIVKDIVENRLSEVEIASLVMYYHLMEMSIDEAYYFSKAMVETGEQISFDRYPVLDKHSIGGVPGDKTTLIVVPIISSLGHTIPKTSSRAITSPAGTADRAEVLMPVTLTPEEMREVVSKVGGCIAWGGALGLAPADDVIIRVEYPLSIDPFLIPSIIAKKAAVGSTHVVIDIPVGRGAKVKTIGDANYLARDLMAVGRNMGMEVACALTMGDQPIGNAAGPALEAREALLTLLGRGPHDLVDKATSIAGTLLELAGEKNGKVKALEALKSGRAYRKFREIIEAQGGNPDIKPEDISIGDKQLVIRSENEGIVLWVNNRLIAQAARLAGAPKDKGAGIIIHVKIGDSIRKGDPLISIFSESSPKLQAAEEFLENNNPVGVGMPRENMLISLVTAPEVHERYTIIER